MRTEEFFQKARAIGPAVHLITMYWAASKPEKLPWFVVMDGEPLTDQEVAAFFGISTFTATRWRRRLMKTGFVEVERYGRGYRIRVQRPPFAMVTIRTLREHSRPGTDWPEMQTQVVQ
jgi:hypothetical protein